MNGHVYIRMVRREEVTYCNIRTLGFCNGRVVRVSVISSSYSKVGYSADSNIVLKSMSLLSEPVLALHGAASMVWQLG